MNERHKLTLDRQHLRAFESTFRLRSLTKAADELGLTQPALSKSLRVLREHFSDPLFVRTPRGMEPTPRASSLVDAIQRALHILEVELRASPQFDPASSDRAFAFYCSDLGSLHFLPRLLTHAARAAPAVQFQAVSPFRADMAGALANGEVDLAIGAFPDLGAGIFQQLLYADGYVCLVSSDHPRVGDAMTIEQYVSERHIIASAHGTGHFHHRAEQLITAACGPKRIAARVPNFFVPPFMLQGTEYVLTLPSTSARRFMRLGGLRIVPCPLSLPQLEIRQYWHERFHNDPALRWLRGVVFELFGEGAEPSPVLR